ncbi:copper transporter [Brevibacterium sp. HMSC063G07]|uniref:copper transporter n=1 Tax=Brevibacterium sp. HMSC063G07 TaxID=1739261 RepID=UPI0008A36AC3|nr:copper transporter [Brevibacterium sp. HMSC063G07]OFL64360.1 hypothetical protein HMPREF2757_00065 [Brevibacterium sp. HMSC063G07]
MIDFRYHLVSLFSVFLALAVGIVLGAGPLKAPIGQSLQGQVQALREDRDNLRGDLDKSRAETRSLNDFVEANAPSLIDDKLRDRTVSVIRAEEAASADVRGLQQQLTAAGANVVEGGTLTKTTFSPEDPQGELVEELRAHVDKDPQEPPRAVASALTEVWSAGSKAGSLSEEDAEAVLKVLRDHGRMVGGKPGKADAFIFVAGETTAVQQQGQGESAQPADDSSAYVEALREIQGTLPLVVAGPLGTGGLVYKLRGDRSGTTVDGIETNAGAVITVLATADLIDGGKPAAYGFGQRAEELYPGMKK